MKGNDERGGGIRNFNNLYEKKGKSGLERMYTTGEKGEWTTGVKG